MAYLAASKYKNGHWVWNPSQNSLQFQSYNPMDVQSVIRTSGDYKSVIKNTSGTIHASLYFKFRDVIDGLGQARFRRSMQRQVRPNEPDVVTIQDIRDVVLLTIPVSNLNKQNVQFVHTATMDFLLRTLIIYYEQVLQVWEAILERRELTKYKIPMGNVFVKTSTEDLEDLRSMVGRAYLTLLTGMSDSKRFHHFSEKNRCTEAEKDVRLFEFLLPFCCRAVWLALFKRNFNLIEQEMHQLFRGDTFNIITHKNKGAKSVVATDFENNILNGPMINLKEYTLLQHSLPTKEVTLVHHDFRLMGIGCVPFETDDPRINYLNIAYSAPEEVLVESGVSLGIIGLPRSEFDTLLNLRFARCDDGSPKIFPKIVLPRREKITEDDIPSCLPNGPTKYDTNRQNVIRQIQCGKWIKYIEKYDQIH